MQRTALLLALVSCVGAFGGCSGGVTDESGASASSSSSSSSSSSAGGAAATATSTSSSTATGGSSESGGSGGMTQVSSDITGTDIDSLVLSAGVEQIPQYKDVLSALTPIGKGMFSEIQGSIATDGSFDIPDVPEGVAYVERPYLLEPYGNDYYEFYVSAIRKYDLGEDAIGRTDWAEASEGTILELNLANMSPWADGDDLEIYCAGVNSTGSLTQAAEAMPAVGDTSLTSYDSEFRKLQAPWLIEGSDGDVAIVTHLSNFMSSGLTYSAVTEGTTLPSFDMIDGMKTVVGAAFAPVTPASVTFDWRRSQFEALRSEVYPSAKFAGHSLVISTDPGGSIATQPYHPMLAGTATDYKSGDVEPTITYVDPFPTTWRETAFFETSFDVSYSLADGHIVSWGTQSSVAGPVSMFTDGPIAPIVSPPRDLEINGMGATATLMGVTTAPTIAWSPPSVGVPKSYLVELIPVDSMGNAYVEARFTTDQTSIQIPPGMMQAGMMYLADVYAESDVDVSAPDRIPAGLHGESGALTGLFSP